MRLGDEGWGLIVAFILIFWGMKRGGGINSSVCMIYVLMLSRLRDEEGRGGRGWGEGAGVNEYLCVYDVARTPLLSLF